MESSCVPPGFRFHPTEEELVGYYLVRKINSLEIDLDVIIDIDLYRMEPWDIQGKNKLLGYDEEQNEWYFFSHKDKKYPTGTRTNRATTAGFWKATGRDKAVLSKNRIIGMRKTLVFYEGRAPNGRKSDWIMHEYRLQTSELGPPQEEGWVVCRAFKKPSPNPRQSFQLPWNNHTYCLNKTAYHNSHVTEHGRQSCSEKVSATPISHSNAADTQYYSQQHFNSSMQDPSEARFEDHHRLSELVQLDHDPSFADWAKNMDSLISCSLSTMPSLIPDDDDHLLLDSTDEGNNILQYFPDLYQKQGLNRL